MNLSVIFGQFLIVISCYASCQEPIYSCTYELDSYQRFINKREVYSKDMLGYEKPCIANIPRTDYCQVVMTDLENGTKYVYNKFNKRTTQILYQFVSMVIVNDKQDTQNGVSCFDLGLPAYAHNFMAEIAPSMDYNQEAWFDFEMKLEKYDKDTEKKTPVVNDPVTFYLFDDEDYDHILCNFKKKPGGYGIPRSYLAFTEKKFVMFDATEPNLLIIHIDMKPESAYLIYFQTDQNYKDFRDALSVLTDGDESFDIGRTIPLATQMVQRVKPPSDDN